MSVGQDFIFLLLIWLQHQFLPGLLIFIQVMAEYVRSCLNIVLLILYTPKAAICTNDKVIATQQRHYKKPVLVSE